MPKAYVFETGTNVWRTYDCMAAGAGKAEDALLSTRAASSPSIRRLRKKDRTNTSAIQRIQFPLSDTRQTPCRSAIWSTISALRHRAPMSSSIRPIL